MDIHEAGVKTTRIVTIGLAVVAFTFITGVTSCIMQDNTLDAKKQAARTEHLKVQTLQEKEQSNDIKILIDKGVNPIAARCTIIGWKTEREAIVCAIAGVTPNVLLDDIKGPR